MRVEDAATGQLEAAVQGRTADIDGVVALVDSLVLALRDELGETREHLAATEPLPRVLTPSLDALMEYRRAREAGPGRARIAVSHLWDAVRADTAFTMAWQLMAVLYGGFLGRPDSAAFAVRQATRFPDRMSEARREDLALHSRMAGDIALWDLALEEAEQAVLRNPGI